jgi:hypothetical protein
MKSAAEPDLRRRIYPILITVAAAMIGGRILAVNRVYEPYLFREPGKTQEEDSRGVWPERRPTPMPTLGANDRSRWDTIRALVENGEYRIGHRDPTRATPQNPYGDQGIVKEEGWETIDKVLRPDTQDFYSSKPTLLPTLLAGEYWILHKVFGWSLTDPPGVVVRIILFTINWMPLVIALSLLARLVDFLGTSDWGRVYVVAAACFAAYWTPFSISLNNHSVAAWSAVFALYAALPLWSGCVSGVAASPLRVVLAGFFAGFTACNELPATSFAVALFALALPRAPIRTLLFFLPAALLPVAGLLLTNYLALGQLLPAYGEIGGPWYDYPGSYWKAQPSGTQQGIDWAWMKESRAVYAFHLLLGHHGVFALSPIFLLAIAGMGIVLTGVFRAAERHDEPPDFGESMGAGNPVTRGRALIASLCLVLVVTVVGFYLLWIDVRTHNYGGWTSGPRWLMWLTPLLLLTMLPCVDRLGGRRWGRALAYVLLGISVLSVSYPAWNPWRHPWLFDFLQNQGWLHY